MQGLGFEVLAQVLESISPSHVMQLTTFNPNNNLPLDMWWLPEGLPTQHSPLVYQLPSVGATQETMGIDPSGTLAASLQLATLSHLTNSRLLPLASMHRAAYTCAARHAACCIF